MNHSYKPFVDFGVVSGANSKGGQSFGAYLAAKGFNLILIDKDEESVKKAEDAIRKQLKGQGFDDF